MVHHESKALISSAARKAPTVLLGRTCCERQTSKPPNTTGRANSGNQICSSRPGAK